MWCREATAAATSAAAVASGGMTTQVVVGADGDGIWTCSVSFFWRLTCVIVGHVGADGNSKISIGVEGGVWSVNVKCKVHTRLMLAVGF
jgi:hypothetical protein